MKANCFTKTYTLAKDSQVMSPKTNAFAA